MFLATALLYPCLLAVLCAGAGLLVDRACGGRLAAPLLPAVGAAALIALSQLTTYISPAAPATPYAVAVLAAAGLLLGRARVRSLLARGPALLWLLAVPVLVYALALAPVLLAGRASFSSFMALADSAVHMIGADYLMRHGQDYGHLDLRNSYGQFINDYYGSSYPSGADTLFGSSAWLLRLPLIWAFQPFNAFMLATAVGPAWLLARRLGLRDALAALAAVCICLPALVYGYELIGSIKELVALTMILSLGAIAAEPKRWLGGSPVGSIPFALLAAAGISALGVGFGAWLLAALVVALAVALAEMRAGRVSAARLLALGGVASATVAVAAAPTWLGLSGSLRVATAIASTSNPGNLHSPLRASQLFGVWLHGSYKLSPVGTELTLTRMLIAVSLLAALLGAARVLRSRQRALAGWLVLMLAAWLAIDRYVTTWAGAKTLMLTTSVVVLLSWGGVAALRASPRRALSRLGAPLLALLLAGGVAVSDAMQYRASNLAPTARYEEMASLNARFAGRGPTLLTDFDEYSLYELRDLDMGGPDFVYPPAALAALAGGYGAPVDLDRATPAAVRAYPLILTRRDPSAARPPSAYRLLWQGSYYEMWGRRPGAQAAIAHLVPRGSPAAQCRQIQELANSAGAHGRNAQLVAAVAPELVRVPLGRASRPAGWGHQRQGLVMSRPGRLQITLRLPAAGVWNLWVQGQIMPTVELAVDGLPLASIGGELSGNSLVPDTAPPRALRLSAGSHRLTVTRPGATLAPGDQGSAVLAAIFLTPAGEPSEGRLRRSAPARWRALCGARYGWVELVAGPRQGQ